MSSRITLTVANPLTDAARHAMIEACLPALRRLLEVTWVITQAPTANFGYCSRCQLYYSGTAHVCDDPGPPAESEVAQMTVEISASDDRARCPICGLYYWPMAGHTCKRPPHGTGTAKLVSVPDRTEELQRAILDQLEVIADLLRQGR